MRQDQCNKMKCERVEGERQNTTTSEENSSFPENMEINKKNAA